MARLPAKRNSVRSLALFCLTASVCAADWPQFRGPGGCGFSTENDLPTEWGVDNNVHWKVEIPGLGWSSPIISGNHLFVTTAVAESPVEKPRPKMQLREQDATRHDLVYRWEVHCLDRRTGHVLWKQVAARGKPASAIHLKNSYATETPVTDGKRVYAYFGAAGLFCYDFAGTLLWKKDLAPPVMRNGWGTASSPVLDGDRVFVQCDNEENSYLAAFHKENGNELWRITRNDKSSWGTPLIWKNKVRTELITQNRRVRSYDPESGKLLWEMGGLAPTVTTTPVATSDTLYVGSASLPFDTNLPLYAIRAGCSGDLTLENGGTSNAGVVWAQAKCGPSMPSPLVYGDYIYVVQESGFFQCLDAKTGREIYPKQRLQGSRRGFSASPWAYDGKVFVLAEDGTTYVIQAGNEFKLLGKNMLDDMFLATPAITNGAIYLRGRDHLYCIGRPTPESKP